MPADIRSFFGGGPKKPAGDAAAKPKEEKLEEPAATVLPKKAKAEEPKLDVDMVDLTDDEPAPKTVAKRKTVVDDVREPRSVPQTSRSTSNVFVVYFSPIAPTHVPSPTALTRPSPHTG